MLTADMHCDTISELYKRRQKGEQDSLLSNHLQVDLYKLKRGGYLLQNFAVFTDIGEEEYPYRAAKNQIALFREEMKKNALWISQAKSVQEIEENQKKGRISAVLTLEEGEICEGDLKKLEEFYKEGVRMMTFTWNYANSLNQNDGLTETGIAFLEKMEELGIIPDVSHLPDKGFYDVCRYAKAPFAASHSNARELCSHKRNLTDDMIRKIAESGGIIGINYYGLFLENRLLQNDMYYSSVSRIADHIQYMICIGGIDCVGLGSDFDGFCGVCEMPDCSKIEFLEAELRKRGLGTSEIEKIFYKNLLRVYKDCW